MALIKKDGEFIKKDNPLQSPMGQIEHQTTITESMNVIDPDEQQLDMVDVDESGQLVAPEDEKMLAKFVKEAISLDNLVDTFNDNSHETLLKLLALQDNKHPLKKGGFGISYRTDVLIMHCKMVFSAEENVVFDAILGMMSSLPEDKSYKLAPRDFLKYSRYQDEKTLYKTFKNGTEKLKKRHLVFDELGPEGDDGIEVPWFTVLQYHHSKNDENAYIKFVPSDFFKDLALCSQLVHGAFGALEVTTQLRGKYTIALYWYLENRKNYRAYPGATSGLFELSVDEIKHQFSMPASYKPADIERRALAPAYKSINSVPECDFTFEYEPQTNGNKTIGYTFKVTNKNYIELKDDAVKIEEVDPFEDQIRLFFNLSGIDFNPEEIKQIYGCAKRNNRDASFMMNVAVSLKARLEKNGSDKINDLVKYVCKMIGNDTTKQSGTNNKFKNFNEREYDYDELEDKLLNSRREEE